MDWWKARHSAAWGARMMPVLERLGIRGFVLSLAIGVPLGHFSLTAFGGQLVSTKGHENLFAHGAAIYYVGGLALPALLALGWAGLVGAATTPVRAVTAGVLLLGPPAIGGIYQESGVEEFLFGLLVNGPFIFAALPLLLPSRRAAAVKSVVGGLLIALALIWGIGLIISLIGVAAGRAVSEGDGRGASALAVEAAWIGLVFLLLTFWTSYAGAAWLADGLSKRRVRLDREARTEKEVPAGDLYVRGLITAVERSEWHRQVAKLETARQQSESDAWRVRVLRRQGTLLLVYGILGAALAGIGVAVWLAGGGYCSSTDRCWEDLSQDVLALMPFSLAYGLILAACATAIGALMIHSHETILAKVEATARALDAEESRLVEETLAKARERHLALYTEVSGGGAGGSDRSAPPDELAAG